MKLSQMLNEYREKIDKMDIKQVRRIQIMICGGIFLIVLIYLGSSLLMYKSPNHIANKDENANGETQEEILNNFNNMFENTFTNSDEYETENKMIADKDIVFSLCNINEDVEGKYNLKLNVPVINLNDEVAQKLNQNTQKEFVDGANALLQKSDQYTIYTVEYESWIFDNILTVVIKSTQKVGSTAQKVIVETYNIDLSSMQELTLKDAIERYGISKDDIDTQIKAIINESAASASALKEAGFPIYERDLDSDMYKIENTKQFYIGLDNRMYIVYPYGNDNQTSEIDIVIYTIGTDDTEETE